MYDIVKNEFWSVSFNSCMNIIKINEIIYNSDPEEPDVVIFQVFDKKEKSDYFNVGVPQTISYSSLISFLERAGFTIYDSNNIQIEIFPIVKEDVSLSNLTKKESKFISSFLKERYKKGLETYGQPLITNNKRSAIQDLLEEILDGMMYSKQAELEFSLINNKKEAVKYKEIFNKLLTISTELLDLDIQKIKE